MLGINVVPAFFPSDLTGPLPLLVQDVDAHEPEALPQRPGGQGRHGQAQVGPRVQGVPRLHRPGEEKRKAGQESLLQTLKRDFIVKQFCQPAI